MIEQLREELIADEGCVYAVYLDHLGLKTVGVGHLCRETDPEYAMEVGAPVSEERVLELFGRDMAWTFKDCHKLLPEFSDLPEEVRLICANMMFNLGANRMGGFKKFLAAVEREDWGSAADEMVDSKWHRQVPERSGRLIQRMRALA
jgi:lysozyme|tara:strand:- start:1227 stop:1667 length:441 start_codon:yes stop_codon:yes gene_type:complete